MVRAVSPGDILLNLLLGNHFWRSLQLLRLTYSHMVDTFHHDIQVAHLLKERHHTSGERVPGRHSPAAQNSQDLEDDELKHGARERERHGEDHLHNVLPHLLKSDAKPFISFPDILNAESPNGKSENLCWILQSEAETWVTQSKWAALRNHGRLLPESLGLGNLKHRGRNVWVTSSI